MTRILAVTNLYPPHNLGGYELSCRDVMTRLVARGHEVLVLCGNFRLTGDLDEAGPVPVRRELELYWRAQEPWAAPLREQLRIERRNGQVLERTIGEFRPDVVSPWHMATLSLGLLGRVARRGLPMVYGICDEWPVFALDLDPWSRHWQRSPLRRAAGRLGERIGLPPAVLPDLGAAGTACFVSAHTRSAVRSAAPWYFPEGPVVPAGVDRSELQVREIPDLGPWRWRVAYFGRFDRRKGIDTLLRAFSLLPRESTLHLYGRGGETERRRLEELAADLGVGDRVRTATLERRELVGAYQGADCVVFPSEWAEPFGLVPLEAMHCGTPVVATGVGGSGEFLRDGFNCVLFPPGDPEALAASVTRLAADETLRRDLRRNGRATAADLDVERMADGYEHWIERAAGRRATRGPGRDGVAGPAAGHPLSRHQAQTESLLREGTAPSEAAVKQLYRDLGDGWWELHRGPDGGPGGGPGIPVLSAPETAAVVVPRFDRVGGLVLDAGCGPSPAVAIGIGRSSRRQVVALDYGTGTVRVARRLAGRESVPLLAVAGDVEHLPFRSGAFDGLVCDDTLEHLPDDRRGAAELARVLKTGGLAVLATPNRHSAVVLRDILVDRWRGFRRPRSYYFVSNSHLREYTWREFRRLLSPSFVVSEQLPVGWRQGPKRRLLSRFLVGPAREISQMIVVEARPRSQRRSPR